MSFQLLLFLLHFGLNGLMTCFKWQTTLCVTNEEHG
ncbi:hypothetical protein ACJW30_07G030500 [Castanea mollissima]